MAQQSKTTTQPKDKEPAKSSREIESEINETRSAITDDIKTLSDKLSPAHLKEEAKEAVVNAKNAAVDSAVEVKDAVIEKAVELKDNVTEKAAELGSAASEKLAQAKDAAVETFEQVEEQVEEIGAAAWQFTRANAVPLALIGVGAGWMIANSRRDGDGYARERSLSTDSDYDDYAWNDRSIAAQSSASGAKRGQSRGRASARNSSSRAASGTRGIGSQATDKARGLAREAGENMRRVESTIADRASQGARYVRDGFQRARVASTDFAEANPLAVAFAGLLAGVGVGLLLPSTERETKLMRPARQKLDALIGDVREAASDVTQVAKDTATQTMHAIT